MGLGRDPSGGVLTGFESAFRPTRTVSPPLLESGKNLEGRPPTKQPKARVQDA